jgi:hypothetical protein
VALAAGLGRAGAATALLAALACSGDHSFAPPGSTLVYSVQVYRCSGGCGAPVGPVDTVPAGDTALVRLSVADSGGSSVAQLRAPCAVNVSILGGPALHTLPAVPTCPDSATGVLLSTVATVRDLVWIVDGSFAAGTYTLRGDLVVDPPVVTQRTIRVQ